MTRENEVIYVVMADLRSASDHIVVPVIATTSRLFAEEVIESFNHKESYRRLVERIIPAGFDREFAVRVGPSMTIHSVVLDRGDMQVEEVVERTRRGMILDGDN